VLYIWSINVPVKTRFAEVPRRPEGKWHSQKRRAMTDQENLPAATAVPDNAKPLSPEAKRALAEAEERRRLAAGQPVPTPGEVGGRAGPDPVRYGDWEKGGIASDF
jgi:hypothetical protein